MQGLDNTFPFYSRLTPYTSPYIHLTHLPFTLPSPDAGKYWPWLIAVHLMDEGRTDKAHTNVVFLLYLLSLFAVILLIVVACGVHQSRRNQASYTKLPSHF